MAANLIYHSEQKKQKNKRKVTLKTQTDMLSKIILVQSQQK